MKHEIQGCEHNLKIEKNKFSLLAEGILRYLIVQ